MLCFSIAFAFLLLPMHVDTKISIETKTKETRFFICFHWNVNSILAHIKLSLLEANNTIHQFDIFCASKTYLHCSVAIDETTLSLPGNSLVSSDHPSNLKEDDVCLYYKKSLSLREINVPSLSPCYLSISDSISN